MQAAGIGTADHRGRRPDLRARRRRSATRSASRDECARHKILDMVGDLALLGMDLHGFVVAHRSGHHTNAALVRKLLQSLEKRKRADRPAPGHATS